MWYVMQVGPGMEERIRLQCLKQVTEEVLEKCFIPYYEEKKHVRGKWILQKKVLFPGYVFVVTSELAALLSELKNVNGLTKVIGTGDEIVPLSDGEVTFLEKFGGEEQVVQMSEGVIEQSKVVITDGPLVGMEGYIRKIDRHKRKAWVEVEMFRRIQRIQVGVEIVSKQLD